MTLPVATNRIQPLVRELPTVPDVSVALQAFAAIPGVLLLESALRREEVGRYSFLTADPFRRFTLSKAKFGSDPFEELRQAHAAFRASSIPGLPPFQGGAAGLLSYELGGCWEKLPTPGIDEFGFPAMAVGLYDWGLAWDHFQNRAWVIAHDLGNSIDQQATNSARGRIDWVLDHLQRGEAPIPTNDGDWNPGNFAPQFPLANSATITSSFSREAYLQAVRRVIEYIHAGDIFQTNLSQRLLTPAPCGPLDLYLRLRERNPAPFSGYFAFNDWAVVSSSPERFVTVRDGIVETRPIKGTRQRRDVPEADLYSRDELRQSEKDQAENVMIVDLLRNDLSRVCRPGSISVPRLCSVESYETVQHLVSVVHGTLKDGHDGWDLLKAVFPGGSITGAPKVRAMEIIAELEPTARGPYCGSLFYLGFDGQMDSSILIRTFACRGGWVNFPVGGGIVAQSDPQAEYLETLHKAEGMLRALE